jgi:hypothetical protein
MEHQEYRYPYHPKYNYFILVKITADALANEMVRLAGWLFSSCLHRCVSHRRCHWLRSPCFDLLDFHLQFWLALVIIMVLLLELKREHFALILRLSWQQVLQLDQLAS